MNFYGISILGGVYGPSSATAIEVVNIIGNLITVPMSLVLLESSKAAGSPSAKSARGVTDRPSCKESRLSMLEYVGIKCIHNMIGLCFFLN